MTHVNERMARVRANRKAAGLQRVELWAHPDDVEQLRKLAAKLAKKRTP